MKKIAAIICGYLLVVAILTYPSVFHLADRIIGDGGDNYQFLSFQYLANKEFTQGQFPFGWTNYWRYPVGFDFSSGYDSTFLLLVGLPLYQIFSDPVVVYNLSIVFILVFNCLLSYFLFRRITQNNSLGFIGGIIYGLSFYVLARAGGHPNLLLTGVFPFVVYSLINLHDKEGRDNSIWILALSLVLVFLASLQYLLISLGAVIISFPVVLIFYREYLGRFWKIILGNKREFVIAFIVVMSVFLFFNYGRFAGFFTGRLNMPTPEIVTVPPINYLFPNKYLRIPQFNGMNSTREWIEYGIYLGFIEIIVFVLFLFLKNIDRKLKLFMVSLLVLFFLIGAGNPDGGIWPYRYLSPFMPFKGIIEPARFYIIFYMLIVAGMLIYLKKFFKEMPKIGVFIILFFIFYERFPVNFYMSDTLYREGFIGTVRESSSKAVLDLPVFTDWWNGNRYDLYSVYYGKPIVNGYLHWTGNTKDSQYFTDILQRFDCKGAIKIETLTPGQKKDLNIKLYDLLNAYGITTLVIHKDISINEKECDIAIRNITGFISQGGNNLFKIFEDNDKTVYGIRI